MLNYTVIQGRLTATPELKYTAANVPYTRFCVANETGATDQDGNKIVYFFDVIAWRKQAEFACQYLAKGRLVIVEGELTARTYVDNNGNNRKVTEISASRLHFSDSKPQNNAPQAGDFAEGYAPRQQTAAPAQSAPPAEYASEPSSDKKYPF